jgi:hypothetical protein
VSVDLGGVALQAGLVVARRAWKDVWITADFGPGLDFVRYHTGPIADVSDLRPASGGLNPRPDLYLRLGGRVDLGAVSVRVEALVVAQLMDTHYDVAEGGLRSQVLVGDILQPGVAAGLSW